MVRRVMDHGEGGVVPINARKQNRKIKVITCPPLLTPFMEMEETQVITFFFFFFFFSKPLFGGPDMWRPSY